MIARLRDDEAGFTIVELLTAMVIGMVVLAAAFTVVGQATTLTNTTQARVDAGQRGRAGLEAIVTELRSGVCALPPGDADPQPPIIYGDGDRVQFYANLAGPNALPQRRELRYDASTHQIFEDVFQGDPPASDPTAATGRVELPITRVVSSRLLLDNVYRRDTGSPIFTYYTYRLEEVVPATTPASYQVTGDLDADPVRLPTPIQDLTTSKRVIQVRAQFRVRPDSVKTTDAHPLDAVLAGAAFSRMADPVRAADTAERLATVGNELVGQPISCS
jgi:type II secretory pathway pseudopilin PulG